MSSTGVVLGPDNRVLAVQRRDNGAWQPPGGIVDEGESVRQACVREVFEETGLDVRVGDLTGVYRNVRLHVIAFVFLAEARANSLPAVETDESARIDWLTPEECRTRMDEAFWVRVRDAVNHATAGTDAVLREHDGVRVLPD